MWKRMRNGRQPRNGERVTIFRGEMVLPPPLLVATAIWLWPRWTTVQIISGKKQVNRHPYPLSLPSKLKVTRSSPTRFVSIHSITIDYIYSLQSRLWLNESMSISMHGTDNNCSIMPTVYRIRYMKHANNEKNSIQQRPASIMQQPASAPTANSSTNSKTVPSAKPTALAKNNSSSNVPNAITATANAGIANKKLKATSSKKAATAQSEDNNDDFPIWCTKTLSAKHGDVIDGKYAFPWFFAFVRD